MSSGLLLNLKPAQLFQFRFTPTEQSRLDVAQGSGSGVVSWFDASSISGHGLLEEDPVTPKRQVRNEIVLAGPEWCFLRCKHGAALFALGNLEIQQSLVLCLHVLRCTRKLGCFLARWILAVSRHLQVASSVVHQSEQQCRTKFLVSVDFKQVPSSVSLNSGQSRETSCYPMLFSVSRSFMPGTYVTQARVSQASSVVPWYDHAIRA